MLMPSLRLPKPSIKKQRRLESSLVRNLRKLLSEVVPVLLAAPSFPKQHSSVVLLHKKSSSTLVNIPPLSNGFTTIFWSQLTSRKSATVSQWTADTTIRLRFTVVKIRRSLVISRHLWLVPVPLVASTWRLSQWWVLAADPKVRFTAPTMITLRFPTLTVSSFSANNTSLNQSLRLLAKSPRRWIQPLMLLPTLNMLTQQLNTFSTINSGKASTLLLMLSITSKPDSTLIKSVCGTKSHSLSPEPLVPKLTLKWSSPSWLNATVTHKIPQRKVFPCAPWETSLTWSSIALNGAVNNSTVLSSLEFRTLSTSLKTQTNSSLT